MPGKDLTFPARRSLNITARLNEHGGFIDLQTLQTNAARQDHAEFTGVLVSFGADVSVTLRALLWDDEMTNDNIVNLPLVANCIHPLRVRRVYLEGTTTGATVILFGQ